MLRSISLIVILLVVATACSVLRATPTDTVKPGTLSGVVTGPTGPVANASVSVTPSDNSYHVGQTDSQGYYVIAGIPAGSVVVMVTAPGYQPFSTSVVISPNGTATQNVSLSQQ